MKAIMGVFAMAALLVAMPAYANKGDMEKKTQYFFQKMDADANGQISKSEHDDFGNKMFDEADTNDDDQLSLNEVQAHKQKEKQDMKNFKNGNNNRNGGNNNNNNDSNNRGND